MFIWETFERKRFSISAGKVYLELLESGAYGNEASQVDSWKQHIQRAAEIYKGWIAARLLGMFQDYHWSPQKACQLLLEVWDMKETKYYEKESILNN